MNKLPPAARQTSIDDHIRRIMEIGHLKATQQTAEPSEPEKTAADVAEEILAADPAIGPVDVIHIGPNADVPDMRYLIVLFQGERAFLFDRIAGRTTIVDLDDRGLTGDDRLIAKLESAKAAATRAKLSKVYVV